MEKIPSIKFLTSGKRNYNKGVLKTVLLVLYAAAFLLLCDVASGQFYKPGNVPVKWPIGGFGVDADAFINVDLDPPPPTSNDVGDWFIDPITSWPGTGHPVFDATGQVIAAPPNLGIVAHFVDYYKKDPGGDLTVFDQSNKISDNPNTYLIKAGSNPPKDDMQHATGIFTWGDPSLSGPEFTFTGDEDDLWCIFAADRWEVNGSSYVDFEFNQAAIVLDGNQIKSSAALLDADGDPQGGRTSGDLLITVEFTGGGGTGNIFVDKWSKDGPGQPYYWKTEDITTDKYKFTLFAVFNKYVTPVPWPIYDQQKAASGYYEYSIDQYVEGAVNLSKLLGIGKCAQVATIWARTKSSHSPTAELKDLAGISNIDLGIPELIAKAPIPVDLSSCTSQADVEAAFGVWGKGFGYEGGVAPVTPDWTGLPSLPPNAACAGVSFTVTYKVADDCKQKAEASSTFDVAPAPKVVLTIPEDKIIEACTDKATVDKAYSDWLKVADAKGGCNAVPSNNAPASVNACGDNVTVTWTVKSSCEADVVKSAKFTVKAQDTFVLTAPDPKTTDACLTQTQVNDLYSAWMAGVGYSGGCKEVPTNDSQGPPSFCGGTSKVTWTISNGCQPTAKVASATFTVPKAEKVEITVPADPGLAACMSQEAVNAAFTTWVGSASFKGGCKGELTNNSNGAPSHCGDKVTVTWTVTSGCEANVTKSADFTVTPAPTVKLTVPVDMMFGTCKTQAEVNSAFATWLAGVKPEGGCNSILTDDLADHVTGPKACGGSITVKWTLTSDCANPVIKSASFSVTTAPTVNLTIPGNKTVDACLTQAAVIAAYDDWLDDAGFTGGCNAKGSNDNTGPPPICGGSVTVNWKVTSDCQTDVIKSAIFTVTDAPEIEINCPGDHQALANEDVAATFAEWILDFKAKGGCGTTATDLSGLKPPECNQKVTVTFTASDKCGHSETCTATYFGSPCGGHIFPTQTACCNYLAGTWELENVCYTPSEKGVSNAIPGVFFYYTTIVAPAENFMIDVVQTKSVGTFKYFKVQQGTDIKIYDDNCHRISSTVPQPPADNIARLSVIGATKGNTYVLAVKYNVKSIIGSTYAGDPPVCGYDFAAKINGGDFLADSWGHIDAVAGCTDNTPVPLDCTSAPIGIQNANPAESVTESDSYKLRVYPNPFASVTSFELSMKDDSYVRIEVYTASGTLLKVMLSEDLKQGDVRTTVFEASQYSHSAFMFRVITRDGIKSGTVVKTR